VLAVVGALAMAFGAARAATYEVDQANVQCSDAGPGSATTPFCTISQGTSRAVAGDIVSVHTGSYNENVRFTNSGTSAAPITVRAASGASVTVTSATIGFEVSSKSWIRIQGFTVSGTVKYGISVVSSSNITVTSNTVTLSGQPVNLATYPGIYVSGSTDCTISANNTHHNSDAGIYVSDGSTGIQIISNASSYNARGYTRAAPGIDLRSGGNTVRGNVCHDNEDSGIQVFGVTGVPSPNNVFVNNLCYNNGDHGIDVSSAGSQVIVGNTIYLSVSSGINVEGPSSGTLVANNICVDNGFGTGRGNIRVDATSTTGTSIDYDLVYLSQSGQTQMIWGGTSYATLAALVSATGQEANGKEANPLWVSASGANFRLTASSPAIDCANSGASGALSTDLEGLPRVDVASVPNTGAGPRTYDDRGAFEFQTSGAVCGNGVREAGEACDGADLGGATCASSGFFCGSGSGLSCNANCTLNTSSCVASCPASDACHTAGTCNSNDRCTNPVAPNGTSCNDANACTQTDTCQSGVCTGSNPVVCTPSDACHTATCNPANGTCTSGVAPNGTACNDGNGCTQTDTCQSGVCTGSNPVVCTASDSCHTAGTCNTSTGVCTNPVKANGTACNDGNGCTQTDTCQSGVCTGSNPVVCTAIDQCHTAGTCTPATGVCSNPAKSNGTACNDGNACTRSDTCQSGVCTGANPVVCTPADGCHTSTCDTSTGSCTIAVAPNGTVCSDGNACTQTDVCQSGTCVGSNPVVCTASDSCHTAGFCAPSTGVCSNPALPDGTTCNDANACTRVDTCQSGVCTGSSSVVCTASDQCHAVGTCSPATGICSNPAKADGDACNDGDACTRTDTCQSGICTGSNSVTCSASDVCHDVGTCDPTTGVCSNPTMPDGTWCDHGNRCNHTNSCQSGVCTSGTQVVCVAIDSCHSAGSCSSQTGLCSNPVRSDGSACDDGNACTTNDTCHSGVCSGTGTPLPGEVDTGVRLAKSGGSSTITWNPAPNSTSSDVARGIVRAFPLGTGEGDLCLGEGLTASSTSDGDRPLTGDVFWYLIRGRSSCGTGPYGFEILSGTSIPRAITSCP
jgi:parallel beta-helix repeat protein